jgi:hypothetical protein
MCERHTGGLPAHARPGERQRADRAERIAKLAAVMAG